MAKQSKIVSDLLDEIESAVEKFRDAAPRIQSRLMNRFLVLIKDLDLNALGEVKPTVKNLRKINGLASEMRREILASGWHSNVQGLSVDIASIQALQVKYFTTIEKGYTSTAFMREMTNQTVTGLTEKLLGDGLNVNVVDKLSELLRKNITDNVLFGDLVKEMETFLIGNKEKVGILQSYSSQIVNDGLNQYAASMNKAFTDDLGLEWYRYVGSIIKDSRPWCVAMVAKEYVHESELTTVSNGNVNGVVVSLRGLIVGTNANNIQVNRGGYNCNHLLLPVATESVPQYLVNAMSNKLANKN